MFSKHGEQSGKEFPPLGALGWEKCVTVHGTAEILDNFAVHRAGCCEECVANYSILNPPSCAVLSWSIPPKDTPLGRKKKHVLHF